MKEMKMRIKNEQAGKRGISQRHKQEGEQMRYLEEQKHRRKRGKGRRKKRSGIK